MTELKHFVWGEIKLPLPFYIPQGGFADYPNASFAYPPNGSFAEAFSVSPQGDAIVGTFGPRPTDLTNKPPPFSGEFHGFLKVAASDQLTPYRDVELFGSYDYPFNPGGSTSARGINDPKDVVGFYRDEARKQIHGYVWRKGEARPTNFDFSPTRLEQDFRVTDATDKVLHNAVLGINNQQIVVGVFRVKNVDLDVGFVAPLNNRDGLVSIDMGSPEALDLRSLPGNVNTIINTRAAAINSNREIVGSYNDVAGLHGYKWKLLKSVVFDGTRPFFDGRPLSIDIFPYASPLPRYDTSVNGINDAGTIVGSYKVDGINHGFVWKPDENGAYAPAEHVTIDIVGATNTEVHGISNNGVFVGHYGGEHIGGRHAFAGYLL